MLGLKRAQLTSRLNVVDDATVGISIERLGITLSSEETRLDFEWESLSVDELAALANVMHGAGRFKEAAELRVLALKKIRRQGNRFYKKTS